jgi:hypothetical protein
LHDRTTERRGGVEIKSIRINARNLRQTPTQGIETLHLRAQQPDALRERIDLRLGQTALRRGRGYFARRYAAEVSGFTQPITDLQQAGANCHGGEQQRQIYTHAIETQSNRAAAQFCKQNYIHLC